MFLAHTSALKMTQLSNVLIVLLSVIKTFDNCVIFKAYVWAIKPLLKKDRYFNYAKIWIE